MLRDLQSFIVNVDASKKASEEMKRGAFVQVNEVAKTFALATSTSDVYVVDRDIKTTDTIARGEVYSDYDKEQDTILVNEFAGLIALQKGVRKATSEYSTTLVDADVVADKYLQIGTTGADKGKLIASATATNIKSLGWVTDNGHKLLGFKFIG